MTWPLDQKDPPLRALSIQSHVARDYVGNSAVVPLFQAAGIHVDALNSCSLSSLFVHTGAKAKAFPDVLKGIRVAIAHNSGGGFPGADVSELSPAEGTDYRVIVSGYINDETITQELESQLPSLLKRHGDASTEMPPCFYVCDPVLGDLGRLYVSENMIKMYQNIIKYASVITPNHYEVGWLANSPNGQPITDQFDALCALKKIHSNLDANHNMKVIIVSSCPVRDHRDLLCTIIYPISGMNGTGKVVYVTYPKREVYMAGLGDVFTAAIATQFLNSHFTNMKEMKHATACAVAVTQSVLDVTQQSGRYGAERSDWPCVNVLGQSQQEFLHSLRWLCNENANPDNHPHERSLESLPASLFKTHLTALFTSGFIEL